MMMMETAEKHAGHGLGMIVVNDELVFVKCMTCNRIIGEFKPIRILEGGN